MSPRDASPVLLPAAALHALRAAVLAVPDGETRLRDAGWTAGSALFDVLDVRVRADTGRGAADLGLDDFVRRTSAFLDESGWGTIALADGAEEGTVAIEAGPWTEADGATPTGAPACHFSTGLLAGFFGRLAGAPLAVLETACRAAGGARCRFLIGSPEAMRAEWERRRRT